MTSARHSGEHTYELIRLSASALIHQRGFEAMSMRQLAEQAGIQAGSLYRYFPSKHCLLFELLCDYFDDLLCAWYEARPRGAAAEQALAAFVDNHLVWHAQRGQQGGLIDPGEARSLAAPEQLRVQQLAQSYAQELRQIIASGVRQGCFHCDDVPLVSDAILALLNTAGRGRTDAVIEQCASYRSMVFKLVR